MQNIRDKITNFFSSKTAMALTGSLVGAIASFLEKLGNPTQTGLCIACFERDFAGALGFHSAGGGQYLRPEIIGLIFGSFLSALVFKEFKARGGSAPLVRFFLGLFAMIGALSFLGCPFGVLLRLSTGNLNALPALSGLMLGIFIGICFLKSGFFLGRSYEGKKVLAWIIPLLTVFLFFIFLFDIRTNNEYALFSSWFGPASEHAPVFVSLAAGLVIGFLAQRTRFCTIAAFRDIFIMRNVHYFTGIAAMVISAFAVNIILGQVNVFFGTSLEEPVVNLFSYFWSFLGAVLAGLCFTMGGGCAGRQLFLCGEGDTDAGFFFLGMLCGAAVVHNFGFIGRPACGEINELSLPGMGAILLGLIFCVTCGFTMRLKRKE
jgi:YedE family putative selenium metabolism protein